MILALVAKFMAEQRTNPSPDPKGKSVTVTILGSGDAFGSGGRAQAGYVVDAGGKRILLEAGPAILHELKKREIPPDSIDAAIVSHLHGDHFAGLPFLFLEYMYESPRKRPLIIAGPPKLEQRSWALMRTMFANFHLQTIQRKIKWVVLQPGKSVKLAGARVSTLRTPHTKPDLSLAMRLDFGAKTLVFTGDSGWTEELVGFSAGADLLLCECTYYESNQLRMHLNYPELKSNLARFDVGRVVLTHIGQEVLNHQSEIDVEIGFDGMKIEV